jgi:hypothetical protein
MKYKRIIQNTKSYKYAFTAPILVAFITFILGSVITKLDLGKNKFAHYPITWGRYFELLPYIIAGSVLIGLAAYLYQIFRKTGVLDLNVLVCINCGKNWEYGKNEKICDCGGDMEFTKNLITNEAHEI